VSKIIAVVKVPKSVPWKPSTQCRVTSYSPTTIDVPFWLAASFMLTPKGVLKGPSWEIPALMVDTSTKSLKLLGPFTVTL